LRAAGSSTVLKWNEEQKCVYIGEARAPLIRITVEEKILVALRTSAEPMTTDQIIDKVQIGRRKVLDALNGIEKYKADKSSAPATVAVVTRPATPLTPNFDRICPEPN
jgi:hypothetical protein